MPEVFWWKVPTWDKDAACQVMSEMPFLLPHEMLHHMVGQQGLKDFLLTLDSTYGPLAHSIMSKQGLSMDSCVALGFHGDGVPFSKTDSLEILSWNVLSQPCMDRIPFTAISKKHVCKCGCLGRHTFHAMLKVLKWSMLQLYVGKVSSFLPDETEWAATNRHLSPGTELPVALMVQARGDWPFLKTLFQVPQWNENLICWLCRATKKTYRVVHSQAPWRTQRYKPNEFFAELRACGVELCPMLSMPGFGFECIVLDWLHVVDLGVSPVLMGSLFFELISSSVALQCCVVGTVALATQAQRIAALWQILRGWYKNNKPPSKLDNLTKEMIYDDKSKKPKLRAKGAECRYLVPFCVFLGNKCQHLSTHWRTVAALFQYLYKLQMMVSGLVEWDATEAGNMCRCLCSLLEALNSEAEQQGKKTWPLKPKVHMLQD